MRCVIGLNTSVDGRRPDRRGETSEVMDKAPLTPIGRHRLRRWLIAVSVVTASWLGVSWYVAHALTHRHRPIFAEPVPTVVWGRFEAHRLTSRDGQELGAWYLPGRDDAPAVLLLHGNGGSRGNCLSRAAHGDSTGDDNDIGYSARHDVVAAVEWLERRNPGRPIVIQGTSMGAAAAAFASRELGHRVRGYILESPYENLKTAVWNRVENAVPAVIGWVAYRGLLAVSPLVLPDLDQIAPVEAIAGVPDDVPVLILAGDLDRMARPQEARALWERVQAHGDLHIFEGSDHIQMIVTDRARYRSAVIGLIDAVVGREGR